MEVREVLGARESGCRKAAPIIYPWWLFPGDWWPRDYGFPRHRDRTFTTKTDQHKKLTGTDQS